MLEPSQKHPPGQSVQKLSSMKPGPSAKNVWGPLLYRIFLVSLGCCMRKGNSGKISAVKILLLNLGLLPFFLSSACAPVPLLLRLRCNTCPARLHSSISEHILALMWVANVQMHSCFGLYQAAVVQLLTDSHSKAVAQASLLGFFLTFLPLIPGLLKPSSQAPSSTSFVQIQSPVLTTTPPPALTHWLCLLLSLPITPGLSILPVSLLAGEKSFRVFFYSWSLLVTWLNFCPLSINTFIISQFRLAYSPCFPLSITAYPYL